MSIAATTEMAQRLGKLLIWRHGNDEVLCFPDGTQVWRPHFTGVTFTSRVL